MHLIANLPVTLYQGWKRATDLHGTVRVRQGCHVSFVGKRRGRRTLWAGFGKCRGSRLRQRYGFWWGYMAFLRLSSLLWQNTQAGLKGHGSLLGQFTSFSCVFAHLSFLFEQHKHSINTVKMAQRRLSLKQNAVVWVSWRFRRYHTNTVRNFLARRFFFTVVRWCNIIVWTGVIMYRSVDASNDKQTKTNK